MVKWERLLRDIKCDCQSWHARDLPNGNDVLSLSQVQSVHVGTYLNGHNEKQYTLFLGLTIKRALNSSLFNLGSPF